MTSATVSKPRAGRRPNLTEAEARELTAQIKRTSASLWLMVSEAHDRKAWAALGYTTWKAYITSELQISESRSFQILDAAKVMKEVARAGAPVEDLEPPPARAVAVLVRGDLAKVRAAAREAVKAGDDPMEAVIDLSKEMREESAPVRRSHPAVTASADDRVECPVCHGEGKVLAETARMFEAARAMS